GADALARAALAEVLHLRRLVEAPTDAVAHEIAHDAAALRLDVLLDGRADVAEARAVLHLGDPDVERASRRLGDQPGVGARPADVERGRRVAVEALVDRGHVDVDDVAVLEDLRAGDAVADDLVDARADALREALVVQRRGEAAAADRVVVDDRVDLFRRHARADDLADVKERLGGHFARRAHPLDLLRAL